LHFFGILANPDLSGIYPVFFIFFANFQIIFQITIAFLLKKWYFVCYKRTAKELT